MEREPQTAQERAVLDRALLRLREEREPQTAQERAVLLLRAVLAVLNLGWLPPTSSGRLLVWAIRITIGLSVWLLIQSAVNETLWNWLQLLIIPAVLAIGGYWFNRQQQERELRVANQHAQDEALQAYLGQMSQLLTNEDPPLHMARPGERLSTVARASTLTVLTRLDGERKGNVVRFLYEAGLITKDLGTEARQVIDLSEAFLDDAYLRGANLIDVDLSKARLIGADLGSDLTRFTWLLRANLQGAYLVKADLSWAHLEDADLRQAHLAGADLRHASLSGVKLHRTHLEGADLRGATGISNEELEAQAGGFFLDGTTMPNGQKYEQWDKSRGKDGENSAPS